MIDKGGGYKRYGKGGQVVVSIRGVIGKRVKTKIERVKRIVVENPRTGLVPRTREQGLTFVFNLILS